MRNNKLITKIIIRTLAIGTVSLSLIGLAGCSNPADKPAPLSKALTGRCLINTASLNKVQTDQFTLITPAKVDFRHSPVLFKDGMVSTYINAPLPTDRFRASSYASDSYRATQLASTVSSDNLGSDQHIYYHIDDKKHLLTLSTSHDASPITSITYRLVSSHEDCGDILTTVDSFVDPQGFRRYTFKPIYLKKAHHKMAKVPASIAQANLLHFSTNGRVHGKLHHTKRSTAERIVAHRSHHRHLSLNDVK